MDLWWMTCPACVPAPPVTLIRNEWFLLWNLTQYKIQIYIFITVLLSQSCYLLFLPIEKKNTKKLTMHVCEYIYTYTTGVSHIKWGNELLGRGLCSPSAFLVFRCIGGLFLLDKHLGNFVANCWHHQSALEVQEKGRHVWHVNFDSLFQRGIQSTSLITVHFLV